MELNEIAMLQSAGIEWDMVDEHGPPHMRNYVWYVLKHITITNRMRDNQFTDSSEYSYHLNTRHVWYLNVSNKSGYQIVRRSENRTKMSV